jgi:hypothetical protein
VTLSQLIAAAYLRATGEVSTLAVGDDDYTKLTQIANFYTDTWATEPGVDWRSLYSTISVSGTVTATDTFALPSTIRKISQQDGDFVRIIHTVTTQYTDYQLVAPERLKDYTSGNYCAQEGSNLVFNAAFTTSSPEYGGTIKVPCYTFPTKFPDSPLGTETVVVDNPNWLVVICAAEYSRTDITRQNLYPGLISEANDLMLAMKSANDSQLTEAHKSQVSVPNGSTW